LLPDSVFGAGWGSLGFTLFFIREEGEVEVVFVDEFLVFLRVVGGDTEDDCVYFLEVGEVIAEVAGLGGAAGGVIFGVEVEYDGFAFVVGEAMLLAGVIGEVECGSLFCDFD